MKRRKRRFFSGELQPIDEVINEVFAKGRFGGSAQVAAIWEQWKQIVGEDVAQHCFPEKITRGKLHIRVDTPVWRQQLDLMKEEIQEKIDACLPTLQVEELVFKSAISDGKIKTRETNRTV